MLPLRLPVRYPLQPQDETEGRSKHPASVSVVDQRVVSSVAAGLSGNFFKRVLVIMADPNLNQRRKRVRQIEAQALGRLRNLEHLHRLGPLITMQQCTRWHIAHPLGSVSASMEVVACGAGRKGVIIVAQPFNEIEYVCPRLLECTFRGRISLTQR
jgi:hypothetical protein